MLTIKKRGFKKVNDEMVNLKKEDEMYCPECGKKIKRNAVICVHCGVQVKELHAEDEVIRCCT
jgi:DNA-directed RNA polymerase subunit RPC12/RpoP